MLVYAENFSLHLCAREEEIVMPACACEKEFHFYFCSATPLEDVD